jgi:hypothetical protein
MSDFPMMTCGCAGQANRILKDGSRIPACIIHDCTDVAAAGPDLTGRKARCAYYGKSTSLKARYSRNECNYGQDKAPTCTCEQPSSSKLPFFEYQGAGSTESTKCKCGYYESAHKSGMNCRCREFKPQGALEFDKFYCGCQGWD